MVLAAASRAVDGVIARGLSADAALAAGDGQDRAAVKAITLGTLRWYLRLSPAIESLLERPQGVPSGIRSLLAAAAHQIEYSRNAPELTVHIAVDAARILRRERSTALVNAVLRRFVAQRAELLPRLDADPAVRTAHPEWLAERILAQWPQGAAVLDANNVHPPMTLRVDLSRSSAAACVAALASSSIESNQIQWLKSAVTLVHPAPVTDLPGFSEGLLSVQDAGAQLAAPLLDAQPGMRVLDACAAPGGKTGHLLELTDRIELTALDTDAARGGLIRENLARLKRTARIVTGDARDPASFWDGRPYERILVDAPCSSTGVIRRHPDIKLLRRPSDVGAFTDVQLAILRSAASMLAPGGRMVYSTCSVLKEENEDVVSAFLASHGEMKERTLSQLAPGSLNRSVGVQLLPGAEAGTDGFYYACLEKTTTCG